jgi:hypothetical protein
MIHSPPLPPASRLSWERSPLRRLALFTGASLLLLAACSDPQSRESDPFAPEPQTGSAALIQTSDRGSEHRVSWFVHSSSPVGTGPSYTGGEPGGNTGNDFNLFVVVTDHVGRVSEDEIIVELDGSAPPCLI